MTEEQAIERIAARITQDVACKPIVNDWDLACAKAAWNEIKAIACEEGTLPAGWAAGIDGPESARPNPRYKPRHQSVRVT